MTDDNIQFDCYEGMCQACDAHGPVNDIGLCEECNAKVDRDLIRKRDWDYSASAFGCPVEKREELRNHVIAEYGAEWELLADEPTRKKPSKARKGKRKKKR